MSAECRHDFKSNFGSKLNDILGGKELLTLFSFSYFEESIVYLLGVLFVEKEKGIETELGVQIVIIFMKLYE